MEGKFVRDGVVAGMWEGGGKSKRVIARHHKQRIHIRNLKISVVDHNQAISRIGKTVSNALWKRFVHGNPYHIKAKSAHVYVIQTGQMNSSDVY